MSQLLFSQFKGDSSSKINGVSQNSVVFLYNGRKSDGTFDSVDTANIDFIKYQINAAQEEEDLESAVQWTQNNGKGKNIFLEKKFDELKLLNIEICDFILKNLNRLYWREKDKDLGKSSDKTSVRSTLDIKNALGVIIPAAKDLQNILKIEIDRKYPSVLATKALEHDININNIELIQRTGGKIGKLKK